MTYCASSFVGRQSQSRRNCYEIIIKTRVHKEAARGQFSRTSREHFHDNISMVTFCNANNMPFMSNQRPSSFPMFVTIRKRTYHKWHTPFPEAYTSLLEFLLNITFLTKKL